MRKQWKNNDSAVNLLHSKKKLNKIFGIPSIPGKLEKFGYVVDKNTELSYPKHVSKPRF